MKKKNLKHRFSDAFSFLEIQKGLSAKKIESI